MERESGILAQEIAIVMWFTLVANAGLWWFVTGLAFETEHRQRYGTYRSRRRLTLDLFRRPLMLPSILGRDWAARLRAQVNVSDDWEIEQQRRKTLVAYATFAAVAFLGLPMAILAVAVLREVFPGTVLVWAAAVDLILMAVWFRRGVKAPRDPPAPQAGIAASVVGTIVCAASLAALVALWQSGGILL